jgi:hypothetical protein
MDWISGVGRRVWLAYQEGLMMNCPAHRQCVMQSPQIAARDSLPVITAEMEAVVAQAKGGAAGDAASSLQPGTSARH